MRRWNVALLVIVSLLAPLVGAASARFGGWAAQAAGLSFIYCIAGAFLPWSEARWRLWRFVLLLAPGTLLLGIPIVRDRLLYAFPLVAMPFVGACAGSVLHRLVESRGRALRLAVLSGGAVLFAGIAFVGMLNWLSFSFSRPVTPFDAPAFTFRDEHGRAVTRESLKGRTVVLDFWTTSCAVCYRKFPELQSLHDRFRDRADVAVYSVHLREVRETSDYPAKFFASSSFDFRRLSTVESRRTMSEFGFAGVPTLVVIDPSGKVVFRGSGMISGPWIFVNDLGRIVQRVAG